MKTGVQQAPARSFLPGASPIAKAVLTTGLLVVFQFLLIALTPSAYAAMLAVGSNSGAAGTSVTIPIHFTSASGAVVGIQFDLTLPAGLSLVTASEGSGLSSTVTSIYTNPMPSLGNVWRFLITTNDTDQAHLNTTLIPDGLLVTAQISIAAGTAAGSLPLTISNEVYVNNATPAQSVSDGGSTSGQVTVTSNYSCPNGVLCDGTNVTGTPNQIVCGLSQSFQCTPTGWVDQNVPCTCPDPFHIVLAPTSLSFNTTVGLNPAPQSVSYVNANGHPLNWTVVSNVPWMSASPTSGSSNQTVNVSITVGNLPLGTVTGNLVFTAAGADNSPQTVPVTLMLAAGNTAPTITLEPQTQSTTPGNTATYTITASGNPAPTYQWQKSANGGTTWVNVSANGTSSSYVTPVTQLSDNGTQFRCVVSNGVLPNATSTSAALNIVAANTAPSITLQPQSQSTTSGNSASFTILASGNPLPSYQWQTSTNSGTTWTNVSANGNSTTYVTPAAQLSDNGTQFRCVVSNGVLPNASSISVMLTVTAAMVALPNPDLSSIPNFAMLSDHLSVTYDPSLNVSFLWTFTPAQGAGSYGAGQAGASAGLGATTSFKSASTQTPSLLSQSLALGTYQVSVQAQDNTNPTHLSAIESKAITLVGSDFSQLRVFPNPWRNDKHTSLPITFDRLPMGATVKIFTVSGHWVRTLTSSIDSVTWDRTNNSGDKVASGVYIYLITAGDSNGQKSRGELVIIK